MTVTGIKGRDPELCTSYRACQEKHDHDGEHVEYRCSFATTTPQGGRAVVTVVEKWHSRDDRHAELCIVGPDAVTTLALTEDQRKALARSLERG